jgi:hypothetical protein
VVEGYDGGGRRSASWSGGRWWGWSGWGGTPWRREAQGVIEGVQEWLEESSAGEVLVATGDSASASALGAFSWRKLLEMWPTQCCEVVHLGGGPQRLIGAAAAWGRARVTTWCGAGEEKKGSLHSAVRSFYSRKRLWDVGGAAAALSVARGAAGEAMGAATWWRPLFEG